MRANLSVEQLTAIHVEITSKCNARCPGCLRTTDDGDVLSILSHNPTELSLNQFQTYFPKNIVKNKEFFFGGTIDDPMMNKNVYDICEYVIHNQGEVVIETNTGANTKETYEKLGKLSVAYPDKLKMFFSVDGTQETNHLYRVNVKWEKVLENMKAFVETGAKGKWQYLVFDHNYDDIKNAKEIANELGIELVLRQNTRNTQSWVSKSKVKNKETKKIETKTFEVKTTEKFTHKETSTRDKIQVMSEVPFSSTSLRRMSKHGLIRGEVPYQEKNISCYLYHSKEIFVAWDMKVWPCCYFAGKNLERKNYFLDLELEFGTEWNDITKHSLEDILKHEYYDKLLYLSITSREQSKYYNPSVCFANCGSKGIRKGYQYTDPDFKNTWNS